MGQWEVREYLLHAVRGQTAVDCVEDLHEAGLLIRHHHERYDGAGWPDGLKGEVIPLGARIIAAADFAVNTAAGVRSGNIAEVTMQELRRETGKLLDPAIVTLTEMHIRELYATGGGREESEAEIEPQRMQEGMIIARDLVSGTGMLLAEKGTTLTARRIDALARHCKNDPPESGVFVVVKR
jgi:HD-GYP domain-containing protein (c-di-GMP phosphodiesterase class II)